MNPINDVSMWLQFIMLAANVTILIINLVKAAAKPTQIQNQRLDALETWRATVDNRLNAGNTHFDEIDHGNKVTQRALLAIMEYLLSGEDGEKLRKARDELQSFLIEK